MKEPKRRHSLSGAVLIMILTIMAVLIIILMTTLTVVTTANQRIYTKFEENQAYYSARSALDVFLQKMLSDGDFLAQGASGTREYVHGDNDHSDDMSQGLGLQLDLYTITSQGTGENITHEALANYAGTITNSADKKDEYLYYFGTKPKGTDIDKITYKVVMPVTSGTSGSYGKLSDLENFSSYGEIPYATITVEILDRTYNLGPLNDGSVISPADRVTFFETDPASRSAVDNAKFAEAIANGSREKDKVTLKITATTVFNGVEGNAVLVCENSEIIAPPNNSNNAITTFGGAGTDNMSVIGGAAAGYNVVWGNKGFEYGAFFAEQNFTVGNGTGGDFHIYEQEAFFIGGDMNVSGGQFKVTGHDNGGGDDEKPYIYVGGTATIYDLKENTGSDNGTFNNIDLVANGVRCSNGSMYYDGNIYCKGDFNMASVSGSGVKIDGDLYVEGDIYLCDINNFKYTDGTPPSVSLDGVSGNVYLNGRIVKGYNSSSWVENPPGNWYEQVTTTVTDVIYDPNDIAGSKVELSNISSNFHEWTGTLDLPSLDDVIRDPENGNDAFAMDLPKEPGGNTITKQVPTHGSSFNQYYQVDSSGNLITTPNVATVTAEQKAFTYDEADLAIGNYSTKQFNETDIGTTGKLWNESNGGGLKLETDSSNDYLNADKGWDLDTGGGNPKYVLKPAGSSTQRYGNAEGGDNDKYMYIHGGGTVEFLLEPGWYSGNIVIEDNTQVNFYAPMGNYSFEKFCVWNETTFKAHKDGTDLYVGAYGDDMVVPKINYYFSAGSAITTSNEFCLTGYIYAPDASIDIAQAKQYLTCKYNNESVGTHDIAIVGSIVCNSIKCANETGVAYINPNAANNGGNSFGGPLYNWTAARYARN